MTLNVHFPRGLPRGQSDWVDSVARDEGSPARFHVATSEIYFLKFKGGLTLFCLVPELRIFDDELISSEIVQ